MFAVFKIEAIMTKKYLVSTYSQEIKEIEVIRETEHTCFIKSTNWIGKEIERGERKETNTQRIYSTRQEAIDFIEKILTDKVKTAEYILERNKGELEKFYKRYKD